MPICITCSTPVRNLYTTYSKADDRTLGKGVRLTQCPNCKRFADKYVEHDYVVLFIDLVLIKPQVYRHLLFNRLGRIDDKVDPSIWRLGILLVLFDVYITWARIENSGDSARTAAESRLTQASVITQYLFFLTLNVLATLAQHVSIRVLATWLLGNPPYHKSHARTAGDSPNTTMVTAAHDAASPLASHSHATTVNHDNSSASAVGPGNAPTSAISTALLVSSCTKLFPILLVIWPTSTSSNAVGPSTFHSRAASYIGWVVLFNNIEALLILLDCGYMMATSLAVAGILARWTVEGWLLATVSLSRDTSGPVGDFIDLITWLAKNIGYG